MTQGSNITVISICFHENGGIIHAYSPDLPGLHVCGKRRETVLADVPEVIRMLYKLNDGVEVTVKMAATAQFKRPKPTRQTGPVRFLAAPEDRRVAA